MKTQDIDFIITIDPECDLYMNACRKNSIVPLQAKYIIDNKEVEDNLERETNKSFYAKIKKGTNFLNVEINAYVYMDFWYKLISLNKPIIHICSNNDRNYQSALIAKDTITQRFTDVNIHVLDSKNVSLGSGMLAIYASTLRSNHYSFNETVSWLEENKLNINGVFTSNIKGKKKDIKKVISKQLENGHTKEIEQTYSLNKLKNRVQNEIDKCLVNPQEQTLYICSYNNEERAVRCGENIKKMYGFKNVFYSSMSPSVAKNFTPDTIALFFYGTKRI